VSVGHAARIRFTWVAVPDPGNPYGVTRRAGKLARPAVYLATPGFRLALETALTTFWESACLPVAACRSRRAQFLLLPRYCNPEISHRAELAWATLSQAGHHHAYELGLTAAELRRLRDEVQAIIPSLQPAGARQPS
jgi:hypothetical protein